MTRLLLYFSMLAIGTSAAACGEETDAAETSSGDRITVVATTTHAADLTRAVAGDSAHVVGLIPANADPHEYELRPDDVRSLGDADVIVRSGGDLDDWLTEALEASGADVDALVLLDHVDALTGAHGHEDEHAGEKDHAEGEDAQAEGEDEHAEGVETDPHWWHDPKNAIKAVTAIRDALVEADPDAAGDYERNAGAYTARLTELDTAAAACLEKVPAEQRKLVTTHDALGYLADRYGFEVLGAVIPSLSTQGQASAGETAELVETIRREGVKAIFTESSLSSKLERAIADEAGATLGDPLYADALGPADSDGATYLEALRANTQAIAAGVSGSTVSCDLPS